MSDERIAALDEEPPQRQEISVHCDQCSGQWFWPTFNGELHLERCHEHPDEEPLDDVLNAARWITHIEVMANEDEHYDALITGYVSEDGFRSGEGTGPTIASAVRAAVQHAKGDA